MSSPCPRSASPSKMRWAVPPLDSTLQRISRRLVLKGSRRQYLSTSSEMRQRMGFTIPHLAPWRDLACKDRKTTCKLLTHYLLFQSCQTCSLSERDCPGHLGHIELCVPVYNPISFRTMLRLLKSKCFKCHALRMSKQKVRYFIRWHWS